MEQYRGNSDRADGYRDADHGRVGSSEITNGKGLTEKTPIFLITAESSNDAISKGFRLGVVDVVLNRSTQIIFASALIISSNCTVIVINWKSWSRNR
ncbi:MAG: hypothetical protein ACLR2G_02190 [Phascolarctobacterium faecium]